MHGQQNVKKMSNYVSLNRSTQLWMTNIKVSCVTVILYMYSVKCNTTGWIRREQCL